MKTQSGASRQPQSSSFMPTPLHIAIIPDGNRRWAKQHGMLPWKGHEKSAENFESLVEWARKNPRISTFTLWAFSTENWKRDSAEVQALMQLFSKYLTSKRESFMENDIRFTHTGRRDRLSSALKKLIEDIQAQTNANTALTLNIALDYGGRDEVVRAIDRIHGSRRFKPPATTGTKPPVTTEIDEATIRAHLDHPEIPDMDLIIRTSGEMRTSNFALWQSTYAEWMFVDTYFPDFGTDDLEKAIEQYDGRKRRFGK